MSKLIKNERTGRYDEYPPYKCKLCGLGNIEITHDICKFCGWEDDRLQNEQPEYMGGANHMSLNQYKKFFKDCKNELQLANNSLKAIKLSIEYYKKNFQKQNEEILRKEETGKISQKIKQEKGMKEKQKYCENMKNKITQLNTLYKPVLDDIEKLRQYLGLHYIEHALVFNNDHHIKIGGEIESVQYPIPSIIC